MGGGKEYPHPQKVPDNTHLASPRVDISLVPRRLKGPRRGFGHLF